MPLTQLVDLLPLKAVAPPALPVEEAAFRGFEKQPVRSRAVWQNIGIVLLVVDLRGEQAVQIGSGRAAGFAGRRSRLPWFREAAGTEPCCLAKHRHRTFGS